VNGETHNEINDSETGNRIPDNFIQNVFLR